MQVRGRKEAGHLQRGLRHGQGEEGKSERVPSITKYANLAEKCKVERGVIGYLFTEISSFLAQSFLP